MSAGGPPRRGAADSEGVAGQLEQMARVANHDVDEEVHLTGDVWMGLRAHGWETLRQAARGNIALSRMLERGLSAVELARRVCASGEAWFATVRHRGKSWLRFNLVNLHVQAHHIERMIELVTTAAREG